jgi:hypothetical protein
MDFFTVPTLTFGVLYCFFVIGHDRRRILHHNVTGNPDALWIALQLHETWEYGEQPQRFLLEARDEKRLLRYQKQMASYELLIVDELGFVPLSKSGAELLFEVFSQRYERGSTLVTSNLPFQEWTEVLGSERLTGALLDRLTHHVHIL